MCEIMRRGAIGRFMCELATLLGTEYRTMGLPAAEICAALNYCGFRFCGRFLRDAAD